MKIFNLWRFSCALIPAVGMAVDFEQAVFSTREVAHGSDGEAELMPQPEFANAILWFTFPSDGGGTNFDGSATWNNGSQASSALRPSWSNDYGGVTSYTPTNWFELSDSASVVAACRSNFTVSAWVSARSFPSFPGIIGAADADTTTTGTFYLGCSSSTRRFNFATYSGGARTVMMSPSALASNTFTHIAATYTLTQAIVYVDGVNVTQRNYAAAALSLSSYSVIVGASQGGSAKGKYPWSGMMDEVCIFNTALSSNTIFTRLYGATSNDFPRRRYGR